MKKALVVFLLAAFASALLAEPLPQTMIRIKMREISPTPTPNSPKAKTAWIASDQSIRIELPPEPAKTGFWVSILKYPDKWHVNEALGEGEYWKEDDDSFGYYPLSFSGLKELGYGRELEFMLQHGFTNRPVEIDGVLCDVWDAFVPGYLATLYINRETGKPFQLEARCDAPSNKLLKKIRYEEYEAGIPFDAALFALPTNIVWTSSNTPPVVFTGKTNFLNWARGYYKNPAPDQVGDALAYINYYKYDLWSSMAMLSILFRDNPGLVPGWMQWVEPLRETTRQSCLYALWQADSEWGNAYLQTVANDPAHRDNKYVAETLLKRNRYAITDMDITSEAIANMHMHAFYMTGDPEYINRLLYSLMNFSKDKNSKEYAAAKKALELLMVEAKENPDISGIMQKSGAELPEQLMPIKDSLIGALDEWYDAKPIPTNTPLSTAASEIDERAFWFQTLSGLLADPKNKEEQELLLAYCDTLTKSRTPLNNDLQEEVAKLIRILKERIDTGETNCVFQFAYAELCSRPDQSSSRDEPVLSLLEKSYTRFEQTPDGAALLPLICSDRLLRHHTDSYAKEQPTAAGLWHTNTMNSLLHAVTADGFSGPARRILFKYIDRSYASCFSKQEVLPWYKQLLEEPDVDPWLREMVAGQLQTRAAWNARGGDWSDTVTRDMWAEFKGHLWEARKHLTKAYWMEPSLPESCGEMITVCMGEGKKNELRKWFDRAVGLQFDYGPAYDKYRLSILPRWFGSHAGMFAFGTECLNTKRFDTVVPQVYLDVLNSILRETEDVRSLFYTYTNLYPQVLSLYSNTPSSAVDSFWLGMYAWGARDYTTATEAFSHSSYKYAERYLSRMGGESNILGEIQLGASSLSTKAEQARALSGREAFEDAKVLYLELLADPAMDSECATLFAHTQIEKNRILAGLKSGKWFGFMPPENMAGWTPEGCRWEYNEAGWLQGTPTTRYARLFCVEPIGDNFELKGELDTGGVPRAGIIFGYSDKLGEQYSSFRMNPPNAGLFRNIDEKGKKYLSDVSVPGTNAFHIQVWNKKVTVYLNGKQIFKNESLQPDGWGRGVGLIGLGDYYYIPDGKVMRYRNLQLRRLQRNPNNDYELPPVEIPKLPEE
jgi:hypothetical protein